MKAASRAIQSTDVLEKTERSGFNDPAFASNKTLPIHRWVPWIAGFSSVFVQNALERHLDKQGTVLDPFAGVGTTLVESILSGHNAVGFEINPYAALACQIKLTAYKFGAEKINKSIEDLQNFYENASNGKYITRTSPPVGFKTRSDFYSSEVLKKVLIIQDFIESIKEEPLHDVYRLAFASTMVRYSNYSYEPSLGRRVSAGRENIEDFAVLETVVSKLKEFEHDIEWMGAKLNGKKVKHDVFNESFFTGFEKIKEGSIDLLVTSPPYLNNYHYNRNTRPHLYWLGFADKPMDFKILEEENFGKFWQTVREHKNLELNFTCTDNDILECLSILREKNPEKGVYGGNGWANYAASYFNDCHRFAIGAKHVLKKGGTALVVVGNSILQGVMIPTDCYLAKIAEGVGLEVVDIHSPRATRVGNSIIQSNVRVTAAKKSDKLYESVVELRRR